MKNQLLLSILMSIISIFSSMGQSAKKSLNYQAVILDPKAIDIPGAGISGQPLSKGKVCLKFTFLNALGNIDYEETQQTTTDEYGLVSISIGTGSYSNGTYKSFESIVWDANVKSMKVAVSYDGCATFKQVSTQTLNYSAYALYAEAVDYKNVREAPTKLSQFSNDAGYLIPKDLDPIKADIKTNTADIKSNTSQIVRTNQTIVDNKKSSDDAFLIVNQTITSLDTKVAENTTAIKDNSVSISTINSTLTDQQNQISDNRNQIAATNNNLNNQIGGLQGQINTTNSTVSNLTGSAEVVSNKSILSNLGGANPSDQFYPSQKATKAYVDKSIYDAVGTGVADATTLAPGKIQLSGDLAGTAASPTVPALANKENTSNKSTSVQIDGTDNNKYPSVRAVKDYVDQATQGIALAADLANKANIASPTFTGTPTAPTPTLGDNSTKLATTAYVDAQVSAGVQDASTTVSGKIQLAGDLGGSATSPTVPSLTLKAPIASPTFTGMPTAPTPTLGDNSTKLATTAFVTNSLAASAGGVPYTGATGAVNLGAYDLTVNGITVGTGGGNLSTNTALGTAALPANTTGNNNTAIGNNTLPVNTTGTFSTANGAYALRRNTTGEYNTANGAYALDRNTTGKQNTAIGAGAGVENGFGTISNTTAIGYMATVSASNTIQLGNTDVTNVKTSGNLTVNGITVGTGGGNVSTNTVIGVDALPANTTGNNNTAIGNNTLPVNTTGTFSTANGAYALRRNTTGEYNTANGAYALDRNTTGKQNTAIGAGAGVENGFGTISNTTAIGYMATVSASNTIQLGNNAVTTIGGQVAWTAASDRRIKKNIVNSNYGLATVLKLRPVEYNLISNDLKQVGFIAQEVQKLVPEVVTGKEGDLSKGEILGITYSNLVPVLTKAIQEQQKQIEDQNSKIAAQQKQIEELIKLVKGQ